MQASCGVSYKHKIFEWYNVPNYFEMEFVSSELIGFSWKSISKRKIQVKVSIVSVVWSQLLKLIANDTIQ